MLEALKQAVYEANMELPRRGLVTYTWGNVSGIDRETGYVVIKPSGVSYGDMTADIVLPAGIFPGKLLVGKLVFFPAHFRKARKIAAMDILLHGNGLPRAECIQDVAEIGVIDGSLALDNGVIVIQNQAGIFQHGRSLLLVLL